MPKTLKSTLKQFTENGAIYKSFSSTPTERQSCVGKMYTFTPEYGRNTGTKTVTEQKRVSEMNENELKIAAIDEVLKLLRSARSALCYIEQTESATKVATCGYVSLHKGVTNYDIYGEQVEVDPYVFAVDLDTTDAMESIEAQAAQSIREVLANKADATITCAASTLNKTALEIVFSAQQAMGGEPDKAVEEGAKVS